MADEDNDQSNWGLVGIQVIKAAAHTFVYVYITVNMIWLASINPSTLEKLLPIMDSSYPKEIPPKTNTGATKDEEVQRAKKLSCDDTLRYYENVDFSSSFGCVNKAPRRVAKLGCLPYAWRGEKAGEVPFAAFDEFMSGSTSKLEFTGPKGMLGYMAFTTYSTFRALTRKILTGFGYLGRDTVGGPIQPIFANLCFAIGSFLAPWFAFLLPIFWTLILFSDLPLGYDDMQTRSYPQLMLNIPFSIAGFLLISLPMCFWNSFYQYWTIYIWAALVAPVIYAQPGELVSIFLCHKEFFAVVFLGLCTFHCQDALAASTWMGLLICWLISALYYLSTLL